MKNALSSWTPRTGRLVLDEHTAPFVPSKYHDGPVEAIVRLDLKVDGLGRRFYALRLGRLLSSERVVFAQEITPFAENFLFSSKESAPLPCLVWQMPGLDSRDGRRQARTRLENAGATDLFTLARPRVRDVRPIETLWCYRFDSATQLGCRISLQGGGDLLDARPSSQRGGDVHRRALRDFNAFGHFGGAALSIGDPDFHRKLAFYFRHPCEALRPYINVFRRDEEERHQLILGCSSLVRRLVVALMEMEVLTDFVADPCHGNFLFLEWHPLVETELRVWFDSHTYSVVSMSTSLRASCAAICRRAGCTPPLPRWGSVDSAMWQWAYDFQSRIQVGSSHDSALVVLDLQKEIDTLCNALSLGVGLVPLPRLSHLSLP